MPDTAQSALDHAIAAVPAEEFHGADGRAVRPCTPADVTYRHLRMLDVRPGANILDIGIGSGLSAALLAHLAGPVGNVTAIDIDPDLAKRAETLYAEHGHHVTVITGDGLLGHQPGAPYDRILVGTTPPAIPDAWLQQLKPGGRLLCGARIADLPDAYAIALITVDAHHRPHRAEVHHGGYTPMIGPAAAGNVTTAVDPHHPDCSLTVVGEVDPRTAAALLTTLTEDPYAEGMPTPEADYCHLKNWILATAPGGLLEAATEHGTGVGLSVRGDDGEAHAALLTAGHLISDSTDSPALEALRHIIRQWRQAGTPNTGELPARVRPEGDSWNVRLVRGRI